MNNPDDPRNDKLMKEIRFGSDTGRTDAGRAIWQVVKGLPGVGQLGEAGERVFSLLALQRREKIRRFIRTFDLRTRDYSEGDREKLQQVLNSPTGAELLGEYARGVLDTYASSARTGLALLYADEMIGRFPAVFARLAIRALVGLTEPEIDLFLLLDDEAVTCPDGSRRELRLSMALIDRAGKDVGIPTSMLYGVVDGFMNRGLLPRGNLLSGFSQSVDYFVDLVWGETSTRFADLLREARVINEELERPHTD